MNERTREAHPAEPGSLKVRDREEGEDVTGAMSDSASKSRRGEQALLANSQMRRGGPDCGRMPARISVSDGV